MKHPLTILCLLSLYGSATARQKPITLDEALSAAKSNRASVSSAQMRIAAAKLNRRSLGAHPATQLFIGHTNKEPIGGTDDDLVLAQPLDLFGRSRAARAVGNAEVERAEAELQLVLADLQHEVIEQYSEVAAAKALSESAVQLQELAQRLHDAIKVLVNEGKLPGVQLSRVAIELERARLTAGQRKSDLKAGLQRLGGLLNRSTERLAVDEFADLKIEPIEPAGLLSNRADLRLLAADIRSAQAETRVASLGNRPEIEVQGRQTSWHERNRQYGFRVQLAIPLHDFGRSRAETAAARTRAEAAKKALAGATRIAESELQAARIELESAQDQAERYRSIVASARALVDKSRVGFTERAITLVELLEGTRALREVEEGFVEARLRLAKSQAAYLKAGGKLLEVKP